MQLWTKEHALTLLPAVALMLILAFFMRKWLLNKPLKTRMIPFQILTVILLLLEVGKQGLSLYRGYDLYCLPFHYCSLFIFVLPVMAFYRGKHQEVVTTITTSICAAVFALMLIYPNLIYGDGSVRAYWQDFFSFHTVTFHNIVVLQCILIFALDLHTPGKPLKLRPIIWFMILFSAVSATMAHLLRTNYANFYTCNVPLLETVRLAVESVLGVVVAKLVYIAILTALNVFFTMGAYRLHSLLWQLMTKKKTPVS